MGHAMLGYLGYCAGFKRVVDAVRDPHIEEVVKRAMRAIGRELHRRWSYRETKQQTLDEYVDWRWARYDNEALNDTIDRVCRDPERKLKRDDRLIGPINYIRKYATRGPETDQAIVDILVGVVAAMHYAVDDSRADFNALRVQVLDDLVNVDSELLNRAVHWLNEFRSTRNTHITGK
jgi:mannitol-1-phosphate/altronate dehydrogenase